MAYYIPSPEKVGGRVLRVPHQIAPMTTWSWKCSNMPKTALYSCPLSDTSTAALRIFQSILIFK